MTKQRYIHKDGIIVDAEHAELLGIEGGEEFEQWMDPDDVAAAMFALTPEQAKAVRDETPAP